MKVLVERDGPVTTVVINRPDRRNAVDAETAVLLREAFDAFDRDPEQHAAVLAGADGNFCAGYDLKQVSSAGTTGESDPAGEGPMGPTRRLLSKPVIAAVNGFALAGGTEILQATDIRIACPEARFGLSEAKRGIIPAGGSLVRLQRQIPFAKAMEILITGDPISAEEAHRVGLVNEIVPQDEILGRAEAVARRVAENGPLAVQKLKEALLRTNRLPFSEAFAIETECAREVMRSHDAVEGPLAFMEKRKPVFTGR